jgi:hypothetical protein
MARMMTITNIIEGGISNPIIGTTYSGPVPKSIGSCPALLA